MLSDTKNQFIACDHAKTFHTCPIFPVIFDPLLFHILVQSPFERGHY